MPLRDEQSTPTEPARKRKSRGKGLRVRSGCQRCKARRVKCDEARPACSSCQRIGCQCEYPNEQAAPDVPSPENVQASSHSEASGIANTQGVSGLEPPGSGFQDPDQDVARDFPGPLHQNTGTTLSDNFAFGTGAFETSPDSAWGGWADVSAEAAPLKWFDLVATDAAQEQGDDALRESLQNLSAFDPSATFLDSGLPDLDGSSAPGPPGSLVSQSLEYRSQDEITLSPDECRLLQHFVLNISGWIDVTDPDRSFAVVVAQMALRNNGVMSAILALAARHLSMVTGSLADAQTPQAAQTTALQYYYQTLGYLHQEMRNIAFLTSEELLATVLLVSTYEMIDGSSRGWERHLKGVFLIQRSQLIHGESGGLKGRIWWAWLRQDIWVAYREKRKILSYYHLTRECSDLGFWGLVDRAVWLLGQCVNYASLKEQRAGERDLQGRIEQSASLQRRLDEWARCFEQYDRRLPIASDSDEAFEPIWINPPAAALAMQVHQFSKILLLEHTPATGGLKDLTKRQSQLQACIREVCGIARAIFDDGALIISTICIFAAGVHVQDQAHQDCVSDLIRAHQSRTGWPQYDLTETLLAEWKAG